MLTYFLLFTACRQCIHYFVTPYKILIINTAVKLVHAKNERNYYSNLDLCPKLTGWIWSSSQCCTPSSDSDEVHLQITSYSRSKLALAGPLRPSGQLWWLKTTRMWVSIKFEKRFLAGCNLTCCWLLFGHQSVILVSWVCKLAHR